MNFSPKLAKSSFLLWTAWRQLISKKRHGLAFMTFVSVFGVVIGVAALIIVLSVMGGFEQELKVKMLKGQPHLEFINKKALIGFSLNKFPVESFQNQFQNVVNIEPFTQADVVLKHGKHLSAVVLFGVDPVKGGKLWGFGDSEIQGQIQDIGKKHQPLISFRNDQSKWPGIVLGEELSSQLGADLGDEIVILSPQASSSSTVLAGGTISRRYVVVGIFRTGLFNFDAKWAVVSLDEGRKFLPDYDPYLDEEAYVTGVAVNIKDPYEVESVIKNLVVPPSLGTRTWKDANAALLFALKLEKFAMGSILMLIVLVAAFSISGTMMMTVFHRKTQVCLLRAIGMNRKQVLRMFLLQGFAIGLVGIFGGLILGLSVCGLLYQLQHMDLSYDFFVLRALPVRFSPVDYGVICLFALTLSIFGAAYPAMVASKQSPSGGLRF